MVDFKESYTLANAIQNWIITGFMGVLFLALLLLVLGAVYMFWRDVIKDD